MYTNDLPKMNVVTPKDRESQGLLEAEKAGKDAKGELGVEKLREGQLSDIARKFAQRVPDNMFSPAEIQGFLLKRKTEPKKALLEVEVWVKEMEIHKAGGGRGFVEGRRRNPRRL
jgi:hypothetical protein